LGPVDAEGCLAMRVCGALTGPLGRRARCTARVAAVAASFRTINRHMCPCRRLCLNAMRKQSQILPCLGMGFRSRATAAVRNVTCGCEPMRTVPRSMPHPSHTSDLRSPRHCRSCRTKTKPARAWPPARCCSTCIGRGGHVPLTCPWCMRVRWKGAEKKSIQASRRWQRAR
jgi:hypothetical protein